MADSLAEQVREYVGWFVESLRAIGESFMSGVKASLAEQVVETTPS